MLNLRAAGLVEPQRLDFGTNAVKNTLYEDDKFVFNSNSIEDLKKSSSYSDLLAPNANNNVGVQS